MLSADWCIWKRKTKQNINVVSFNNQEAKIFPQSCKTPSAYQGFPGTVCQSVKHGAASAQHGSMFLIAVPATWTWPLCPPLSLYECRHLRAAHQTGRAWTPGGLWQGPSSTAVRARPAGLGLAGQSALSGPIHPSVSCSPTERPHGCCYTLRVLCATLMCAPRTSQCQPSHTTCQGAHPSRCVPSITTRTTRGPAAGALERPKPCRPVHESGRDYTNSMWKEDRGVFKGKLTGLA